MADQLAGQQQQGAGPNGQLNTGSVFGLSYDEAAYPLLQAHGTPGVPGRTTQSGFGRHPRTVGGTKGKADQYGTVLQGVSAFYHLSAGDRDAYTMALVDAGYLKMPKKGSPSQQSIHSAWKNAVIAAARSGMTIDELLDDAKASFGGMGGDGGAAAAPLSATVSNPLTLKANFKKVARAELGEHVSDAKLDALVTAFQSLQANAQFAQQSTAQTGGVSTAAPEFADFAEQKLREVDPLKADARKKLRVIGVLQRMMTADPTAAPSIPDVLG